MRRALLLIGLLAAGCGREAESDPTAAAAAFFTQLAGNQPAAAFAGATFFFQHQQTFAHFETAAHETGLTGCAVRKIGEPAFEGNLAKVPVQIRTRYGNLATLSVVLTRDRGAWRVFSVKAPRNIETGIAANPFTRIGTGVQLTSALESPIPDEKAALAMAKETMRAFHDAIQQKSFEEFYDGVAGAWQRQLTLGMLTRTFDDFLRQRTNLIAIKDLQGALKVPPRIDSDGLLEIVGSFPAKPHRIDFDIHYYYEIPNWRPFGIAVRLIR